ncbi:MAG: EscS/YscS/HrcS family type III secretion system export apparatus protein, partial [Clostridiaceae bacterium]|nr:EscS/YscS/HrcS family type III secretion system export apparatus protein [Clostridiaceae bacterium]
VTILVIGPWMMNMLVDFTNNLFMQINTLVK